MPGVVVDGHDFFAVHEAAGAAIERARAGGGPSLLECKVNRYYGHFEGDQQTYRAPGEVGADDLRRVDAEVEALIDDAVTRAKAAPEPEPADLLTDVYVKY
jgi:pyruvate dehydrogenase E1 component alpha subunit